MAVLRSIIGIKVPEMAELVGCAMATIQSLESGRLKISEDMAYRIMQSMSISLKWLLAGDVKAQPKEEFTDKVYTKETFERAQASKAERGRTSDEGLMSNAIDFSARMVAILSSANKRSNYWIAYYKFTKAIQSLHDEFGQDLALYKPTQFNTVDTEQALATLKMMSEGALIFSVQLLALYGKKIKGLKITRRRRRPSD